MNKKVYLICPVRECTPEINKRIEAYVKEIEAEGKIVHYPPRDVDQTQDGFDICDKHQSAMMGCHEIHIWWDSKSSGSHFDLGMAFMLSQFRRSSLKFVLANPEDVPATLSKSFNNIVRQLCLTVKSMV